VRRPRKTEVGALTAPASEQLAPNGLRRQRCDKDALCASFRLLVLHLWALLILIP
jgi:hypothetical protein